MRKQPGGEYRDLLEYINKDNMKKLLCSMAPQLAAAMKSSRIFLMAAYHPGAWHVVNEQLFYWQD